MESKKTVEIFINQHPLWREALIKFREVLLRTELEETVKWGMPVYTLKGKHVVGMSAFKSYVGLWFYQGAFLSDPKNVLVNAQDGKTKGMRQLRFTSMENIDYHMIKSYIAEAIQNQKEGKEIKPDRKKPLSIPDELISALKNDSNLNESFEVLTLSKQREYAEYITDAKRAETRQKRLEKIIPMINLGIGLNDKYKN